MEELRNRSIIEDYSLTQTTLDEVRRNYFYLFVVNIERFVSQVFVRFASEQTELLVDESEPKTFKQKMLNKMKLGSISNTTGNDRETQPV